MNDEAFLWAWGALCAFLFSSGVFGASLWGEQLALDPVASRRARNLAIFNLVVSVIAGGVAAQLLSPILAFILGHGVEVEGYAFKAQVPGRTVAAGIGFFWTPTAPVITERVVSLVKTWKAKRA